MTSILPTLRFIATHPLSSKSRLGAFWRYGRWQIESRLRHEIEFQWIGNSRLIVRNGMTGATGNIYCGLHEFPDMAFVLHLLHADDLFVDVGANIGSYTVLASAVCCARTMAIEPDADTMQFLLRNVTANGLVDKVRLVEAAVGAKAGRLPFLKGQDTTNRVARPTEINTRDVEVRTLDEILECEEPVLVKIDVEGFESEAIVGARKILRNLSLRAILIETVDDTVRDELDSAGFEEAIYDPFERVLSPISYPESQPLHNSLFVRDVRACQQRLQAAPIRDVFGHRL